MTAPKRTGRELREELINLNERIKRGQNTLPLDDFHALVKQRREALLSCVTSNGRNGATDARFKQRPTTLFCSPENWIAPLC